MYGYHTVTSSCVLYCYLYTDKWKVQVSGVEQCDSTKQCHQAKLWPSVFYLFNVTLRAHTDMRLLKQLCVYFDTILSITCVLVKRGVCRRGK